MHFTKPIKSEMLFYMDSVSKNDKQDILHPFFHAKYLKSVGVFAGFLFFTSDTVQKGHISGAQLANVVGGFCVG